MGSSSPNDHSSRLRPKPRLRQWRRNSGVFILLFLAGVFSLRGWRASTMISYVPHAVWDSGDVAATASRPAGDPGGQCTWELNGPLLYRLQRPKEYNEASDWYQVVECFVGRRAEFKGFFSDMDGADVYLKDDDTVWTSRLTPMTRLLVAASLTSAGVKSVHFIGGSHPTFSYTSPSNVERRKLRLRGFFGGGETANPPLEGQVGVLYMDERIMRNEVVIRSRQQRQQQQQALSSLDESLLVSTASISQGNMKDGGVSRKRGGGRSKTTEKKTKECVKFVGDVGSWAQKDRNKWFPEEGDVRDFLRALDNFCPISWLKEEAETEVYHGNKNVAGDVGESGAGIYRVRVAGAGPGGYGRRNAAGALSNSRKRKVIIYQRGDNGKLRKPGELADELHDRMALLGWSIEKVVHDDLRPPCALIDKLAGADVLLTPHGFQSMLSLFLRPGSILFEVHPHKYFRQEFGSVASRFGLRYKFSTSLPKLPLSGLHHLSTGACMRWSLCRWYLQRSDVELSGDGLEELIALMLDDSRIGR